jgi:hypothetical protein
MRTQIVCGVLGVVLAGCGGVLPHETSIDTGTFQTYEQVMTSYDGIHPGQTRADELPKLGFDTRTTPNIEVLSYTDIVNHFLPSETMSLSQAPPGARRCMEAQDHCSGYVLQFQHSQKRRSGGVVPDLLGIQRDTVSNGWSAKVVLLLQDNTVVYKELSGRPNMQEHNQRSQPLGPLQDLSKGLTGSDQTQ